MFNADDVDKETKKRKKITEKKLRKIFRKADTDNSGVISKQEFMNCLGKSVSKDRMRLMMSKFDIVDKDKSGYLDFDEFRSVIKWYNKSV